MLVADPVLIESRAAACAGTAPPTAGALTHVLRGAAAQIIRARWERERLFAWHRRQRPALGSRRVSPRAWRRQSALICLRAGLDPESGR